MSSRAIKKAMVTALAGATVASSLAAPPASARPLKQSIPAAAGDASDTARVSPPPSSIAVSAAGEYDRLRSAGPPATESRMVVEAPTVSGAFDLPSAAIGAAAGTALLIVLLAAAGLTRRRRPLTRQRDAART